MNQPFFWTHCFGCLKKKKVLSSRPHTWKKKRTETFPFRKEIKAPGPAVLIKVIVPDSEKLESPGKMRNLTSVIY